MDSSLRAEKSFWLNPKNYHHFTKKYWEWELKRDNLSFSLFKDKIVCEIGCGPFGMIYTINNAKKKIGVDPLISYYKSIGLIKENKNIILYNAKGEIIKQIKDKSIDIVICFNVIDHTKNPDKVISEIFRIMKDEGILYLRCNIFKEFFSLFKKILRFIDPPHPHHFSRKNLRQIIENQNFRIIKENYYKLSSNKTIKEKIGYLFAYHYYCICKKMVENDN